MAGLEHFPTPPPRPCRQQRPLPYPAWTGLPQSRQTLALCCERLADDWQQNYGHPVLMAESFVDSQLFRGTCCNAQGWTLLGDSIYLHWRKHRKNQRQSTVKDFHDAMNRFNNRLAFATITVN